jgi:hypothetical protein
MSRVAGFTFTHVPRSDPIFTVVIGPASLSAGLLNFDINAVSLMISSFEVPPRVEVSGRLGRK